VQWLDVGRAHGHEVHGMRQQVRHCMGNVANVGSMGTARLHELHTLEWRRGRMGLTVMCGMQVEHGRPAHAQHRGVPSWMCSPAWIGQSRHGRNNTPDDVDMQYAECLGI
jgi:hypothetical protein